MWNTTQKLQRNEPLTQNNLGESPESYTVKNANLQNLHTE